MHIDRYTKVRDFEFNCEIYNRIINCVSITACNVTRIKKFSNAKLYMTQVYFSITDLC